MHYVRHVHVGTLSDSKSVQILSFMCVYNAVSTSSNDVMAIYIYKQYENDFRG